MQQNNVKKHMYWHPERTLKYCHHEGLNFTATIEDMSYLSNDQSYIDYSKQNIHFLMFVS